jgi:hypothetical protein
MKKYTSEFSITAATEAEAKAKMTALTALASKLTTQTLIVLATKLTAKELEKLADVVQNNPVKTALGKKYLGL